MTTLFGFGFIIGAVVWLVVLIATRFSTLAVSVGLLTAVYVLSGTDGSNT